MTNMRPMTEDRINIIFKRKMISCPKCGSWNIKTQAPIIMDEDVDIVSEGGVRKLLGAYARQIKKGPTMLQGPVYLMCWGCFHHGPEIDCTGMTSAEIGKSVVIFDKICDLWNSQIERYNHGN